LNEVEDFHERLRAPTGSPSAISGNKGSHARVLQAKTRIKRRSFEKFHVFSRNMVEEVIQTPSKRPKRKAADNGRYGQYGRGEEPREHDPFSPLSPF
jgi:hypothetical protein